MAVLVIVAFLLFSHGCSGQLNAPEINKKNAGRSAKDLGAKAGVLGGIQIFGVQQHNFN